MRHHHEGPKAFFEAYTLAACTWLTTYSHANAHCIMKVLKGSLTETRYAWPTVNLNKSADRPLEALSSKTYKENEVTYMSDKLGLHRISNSDPNNYAVSLHC
jgi:cysteine dioxygenase